MKAKDLISDLQTFPDDWDVVIEVDGKQADIGALDMESWKGGVAIIISDYKES